MPPAAARLATATVLAALALALGGCSWINRNDDDRDAPNVHAGMTADPRPGTVAATRLENAGHRTPAAVAPTYTGMILPPMPATADPTTTSSVSRQRPRPGVARAQPRK